MKKIYLLFLLCFPSLLAAQVFHDELALQEIEVFGELSIKLPACVLQDSMDADREMFVEIFEDLGKRKFRDESGKLTISLNQRDAGISRGTMMKLTERMAQNFYKGTIYRNELIKLEDLEIHVVDLVGYWNGAKEPSSILFLSIFSEKNFYSMSLRYPEADFDYSDAIKEEIIYSIQIKP